jgi:hypothetical protein
MPIVQAHADVQAHVHVQVHVHMHALFYCSTSHHAHAHRLLLYPRSYSSQAPTLPTLLLFSGSYSTHALCVIFGAAAVSALRPSDVEVVSTASLSGRVDWDTTVTLQIGGAVAVLTHRAADDARPSLVRGARGAISFVLPYLHSVTFRGLNDSAEGTADIADDTSFPNMVVHDTSYGDLLPLTNLAEGELSAPHGLHPGLGVQAAAVQHELLAAGAARGPGKSYLTVEEMRAVAHVMDLVRRRIPTHLHYQEAPSQQAE